ncbi:MAG: hypothetical protein CL934_05500 [Deltaproteobacteria bacterium]|nr:hypothetical protein [Deltaproteobacteria bacterium]
MSFGVSKPKKISPKERKQRKSMKDFELTSTQEINDEQTNFGKMSPNPFNNFLSIESGNVDQWVHQNLTMWR